MLKLKGYGIRPWKVFELDPSSGRYTKRRVKSEPSTLHGYHGVGQELRVKGLGRVLCSVFLKNGELVMRMGTAEWNLFEPGIKFAHQNGLFHCELTLHEPSGKQITFRYRRTDLLLAIIDPTYDDLDSELANLPATLPSWAERDKTELIAWWAERAAKS
jgi:hypothetical protein